MEKDKHRTIRLHGVDSKNKQRRIIEMREELYKDLPSLRLLLQEKLSGMYVTSVNAQVYTRSSLEISPRNSMQSQALNRSMYIVYTCE